MIAIIRKILILSFKSN